jgi:DNA-directed RNA polymerase subunit RPC12/RpoP
VRLALRNFRNKSGFHECPRCKSRSVWKADPQNLLEETLRLLLKVSPYRCARCDKRFMDSKTYCSETTPSRMTRWFAHARSAASKMLESTRRNPFEDALLLNANFIPKARKHDAPVAERVEQLTKAS